MRTYQRREKAASMGVKGERRLAEEGEATEHALWTQMTSHGF